jgi:hypothetical protein
MTEHRALIKPTMRLRGITSVGIPPRAKFFFEEIKKLADGSSIIPYKGVVITDAFETLQQSAAFTLI